MKYEDINKHNYPLGFLINKGTSTNSENLNKTFVSHTRQMALLQKETIGYEGDLNSHSWRLTSDEGGHLKGSDLAPFPFWWIKGAPNIGGPTVTASGLTFIAATSDFYLRAFNTLTGEELAKFRLPTGGHATPMTYKNKNGKQFVVIAAGGHWAVGSPASDHLIAYALPDEAID